MYFQSTMTTVTVLQQRPTCQTKGILPSAIYQLPVACLLDKSKQQASYSANAVRISVFYRREQ